MNWLRSHKIAVAVPTVLFLVMVLFLVGYGLGASSSEKDSSSAAQESSVTTVENTETVTVENTETVTVLDTLDAKAKLVARGKTLDAKAANLASKEAALRQRENAVSGEEARIEASTFSDGTFLVGTDIPSGNYIADGGSGSGCYWARMNSSNTEIIDNHLSLGGQVRVTIFDGEIFETQDCGTWQPG